MPQNETDMQEVAGTKAERVAEQTKIRLGLLKNGYTPLANRDKMCVLEGWPGLKVSQNVISNVWADQLRYTATGVRVDGRLVVLDFDIDDDDMLDAVYDSLPEDLLDRVCGAPTRKGKGAKVAVFMRLTDGEGTFGRIVSQAYAPPGSDQTCRLEVFGSGEARQFGAFGPHSHDDDGAVAVLYRWVDGLSLLDVPIGELPEISRAEVLEVCDAASWAMREGGWEYEVKSKSGVVESSVSYVLDDEMSFDTRDHGDGLSLAELEDLCGAVGEGVRLSAGWLEGPSAVNTSRCIARLNDGDGRVQIWESADCRLYRPAALNVHSVVSRLADRFSGVGGGGGGGGAEKVSAGAKDGDESESVDRWSALVASAEDKGSVFSVSSAPADAREVIDLSAGRMSAATLEVAMSLADTEYLFSMSDRLVGVLGGVIREMTEPRLALEIGAAFRCIRKEKRGKNDVVVNVDPNSTLVKQVLAYVPEADFRPLRGVVDIPVLRRSGEIVADGYDVESCLLVSDSSGSAGHMPEVVDTGAARRALEVLWQPFSDFPFVTDGDRGGALACLLTAACRAWLPTAPLFAFDAPVQGSGKSLLCRAIGALSGRCLFSAPLPLKNEDEIRKRLMSMLLSGPSAVIYDNQIGLLDSASLAAVLTSETFSDRELGHNTRTLQAPTSVLVMVNGNNMALGGDMPRRSVRVRIDPQMDTPFEREFDFDPETWVRDNRGKMLAAALTLLQWGMAVAGKGRIGSFEQWDHVVGQTVARIGAEVDGRFGDPADVIRAAHEDDPRRDELGDLLTALRAEFGNKWFTASEVSARMAGGSNANPLVEAFGYDKTPSARSVGRHLSFRRDAWVNGLAIQVGTDTNANTKRFRVWAENDSADVIVAGEIEARRAVQKERLGAIAKPGK